RFNPGTGVVNLYSRSGTGDLENEDIKLTVTPQGNVGIGTTSPLAALDVNGDIVLSGTNRMISAENGSTSSGASMTLGNGDGGDGGNLQLSSGAGSSSRGSVTISGNTAGGAITLHGGSTGNGGNVTIASGNGG